MAFSCDEERCRSGVLVMAAVRKEQRSIVPLKVAWVRLAADVQGVK